MPWKKGKVKFDDGTIYPAELLVKKDGEVWNMKIFKENNTVEEIDAQEFAQKLNKNVEEVYPFSYEIEE